MLEIVADIDRDEQLARLEHAREAVGEPCAADPAGQRDDHWNRSIPRGRTIARAVLPSGA